MRIPVRPRTTSVFLDDPCDTPLSIDTVRCPSCNCDDFHYSLPLDLYRCNVCGMKIEPADMEMAADGVEYG